MTNTQRTALRRKSKVHRNFKLDPKLNGLLKRQAARENRTETAVVEMALRSFFNITVGGGL